ncbi:tyrosine-type recombinase/integrase [Thiohalospira halophila]|uniref:tyrosine-type recombinase/integrase n=1 Tax=Thiohalospira halophila TaxID=381300 RepID=UPI001966D073|nr:tyrosine-type recombinase/integrase [Thiohalospira halophila]
MAATIAQYRAEVLVEKAANTQSSYDVCLRRLEQVFGHMPIQEIQPRHVARYLDEHFSHSAANRDKSVLSSVYAYALRRGLADRNPCRDVRSFPEKPRERYVTDAEFRAVRSHASASMALAMDLAYITARRKSELIALRWSDVTEDGLRIQPKKGGRPLVLRITPALASALEHAKNLNRRTVPSVYILTSSHGQPYTSGGFGSTWRNTIKRAMRAEDIAESFTFHDLRAKSLTDYHERGEDAQALAGHRSRSTTEAYLRAKSQRQMNPLDLIDPDPGE